MIEPTDSAWNTPPPIIDPPAHGGPIAFRWALVAIFFLLLITLTLENRSAEKNTKPKVSPTEMVQVRMALQMESFARSSEKSGSKSIAEIYRKNSQDSLRSALSEVKSESSRNPESAAMHAAIATALNLPIPDRVLDQIRKKGSKDFIALSEIYSVKSLSPKRSQELAKQVEDIDEVGTLAAYQAREKGGDKGALERAFPKEAFFAFIGLVMVMMGGVILGIGAWALFFIQRNRPEWAPRDHPFSFLNPDQASKLGLLGVGLIGLFVFLQVPVEAALKSQPDHISLLAGTALFLTLFFATLSFLKIGEKSILSFLNQSSLPIWRQILLGIAGWAANLPIIGLLLVVMAPLMKSTQADHPLNDMISQGGGSLATIALFFAAAVSAPLWEEIVFRGALFGGMRSALRSRKWAIPASIVMSSLCFAAIHPQGPALWLTLGWIGAMGCLLTYYTRSIIPAIVMHAVHNGLLVALSLMVLG